MDESRSFLDNAKFTGFWIPRDVVALWQGKEISTTEMILLAVIEALDGPDGCTASNNYLGQVLRMKTIRHVTQAVANLKQIGQIEQTAFDGRQRTLRRSPKQTRPKLLGTTDQKVHHIEKTINDSPTENRAGAKPPPKPSRSKLLTVATKQEVPSFDVQCCRHLEAIAMKRQPHKTKPNNAKQNAAWHRLFYAGRLESKLTQQQIQELLTWYEAHGHGKFVPRVFSPTSFWEKVDRLIAARERWKEDQEKQTPIVHDCVHEIAQAIGAHKWNPKQHDGVLWAIQRSIGAHLKFHAILKNRFNKMKAEHPERRPDEVKNKRLRWPRYFLLWKLLREPIVYDAHEAMERYWKVVIARVDFQRNNTSDFVMDPCGHWYRTHLQIIANGEGADVLDVWIKMRENIEREYHEGN